MLFKNLTTRKYLGLAMITLSVILILAQFGLICFLTPTLSPLGQETAVAVSIGTLLVGSYLLAGPLGSPPGPPDSLSSRFWFFL